MEDMYPSIFIQFMNEAKRRNLIGTPLTNIKDGAWIYMVDQGPMGVERPCDIKALYLSNPDTNNFNNFWI